MEFDLSIFKTTKAKVFSATDEVGRGPLAGPVVACSVQLDCKNKRHYKKVLNILKENNVTDSKKLSASKRRKILSLLGVNVLDLKKSRNLTLDPSKIEGISFCISEISPRKIEKINILNASLLAMKKSLESLNNKNELIKVLVDGNKYPPSLSEKWEVETVIKGDSKSLLIGLASIIAKEYRDNLMEVLSRKYPGYGLENHSGYPTKSHRDAIQVLGISAIHRKTFKGVKEFV